ncbi:hypothetical protein [Nocardia cyriacigeorgica]|uniref:hypothetical protein n=1 Tax=Nocardia cyriacigeorgica TaxID=135487 RepID=UPI002457D8E1|nr:hypothetical protein [Nocardia cyriacigeorgica]
MAINGATPQDTESIIFGSGASTYHWWKDWEKVGWDYDEKVLAPDDWVWRVTAQGEDGTVVKDIRHADIMRAARNIPDKELGAGESVRTEARNIVFNVDECDADAWIADAILQVAVFGKVVY